MGDVRERRKADREIGADGRRRRMEGCVHALCAYDRGGVVGDIGCQRRTCVCESQHGEREQGVGVRERVAEEDREDVEDGRCEVREVVLGFVAHGKPVRL